MYLVVYKTKDLELRNIKYGDKGNATKKFYALKNQKALSVSLYHRGELIKSYPSGNR